MLLLRRHSSFLRFYFEYKLKEKAMETLDNILGFFSEKNLLYYIIQMRLGNLSATMADGCKKGCFPLGIGWKES